MIVNCNDLWTRLVHVVFKVRRCPVLTNTPPEVAPVRRRQEAS